jgi:CHAT domain-containing protein
LIRWLHNTPRPGRRIRIAGNRVHYVIPEYLDPALELDGTLAERDMLQNVFDTPHPIRAESVSVAEFLQKEAVNSDVLHFACHGEAAQRAVLRADLLMTGVRADGGYILDPLTADVVKTHARFRSMTLVRSYS